MFREKITHINRIRDGLSDVSGSLRGIGSHRDCSEAEENQNWAFFVIIMFFNNKATCLRPTASKHIAEKKKLMPKDQWEP